MAHVNRYNRPKSKPEAPSGMSRVEIAGYVPAQIKIESLMNAGRRLIESRREQFDFPPGEDVDETFHDPTRKAGLDRVDIDTMKNALTSRMEKSIKQKDKGQISGTEDTKNVEIVQEKLDTK